MNKMSELTSIKKEDKIKGSKRLPLEGIRVLDFGVMTAGHFTTTPLASFGAQVILIESTVHRRAIRFLGRLPGTGANDLSSPNQGNNFNLFNFNKLSITVDLRNPRGLDLVKRLVKISDVVTDNLRPGAMKSFGLDYEELKKIKPDIIAISMPSMGRGGPYQEFRSLSWNLQALCGWNYMTGPAERMPINPSPASHPDHSCNPFHSATAILAALCYRAKTGRGQFIELAQFESSTCFTETGIFEYLVNGQLPKRMGNRLDYAAPQGVYRCLGDDRWCAISVFTEEEWKSLCRAIGQEKIAAEGKFNSLSKRLQNHDELDRIIEKWTSQQTAEQVMELLQNAGVAAGVVQNVKDILLNDPQLRERGYWIKVNHPEAGEVLQEDWAFRLSKTPAREWKHAPLLGEHNDYVLKEILHMPDEEINQYIVEGVVA